MDQARATQLISALMNTVVDRKDINSRNRLWSLRRNYKIVVEKQLIERRPLMARNLHLAVLYYFHLQHLMSYGRIFDESAHGYPLDQALSSRFDRQHQLQVMLSYLSAKRGLLPQPRLYEPGLLKSQNSGSLPLRSMHMKRPLETWKEFSRFCATQDKGTQDSPALREMSMSILAEIQSCLRKGMPNDMPSEIVRFMSDLNACKSIAIVTKGPSLTSRGLGATIDSHDIVIRVNFPSDLNTRDHGSRTDYVLHSPYYGDQGKFNISSWMKAFGEAGTKCIPLFGTSLSFQAILPSYADAVSMIAYPNATAGLKAIIYSLLMNEQAISTYGFDFYGSSVLEENAGMDSQALYDCHPVDYAAPGHDIHFECLLAHHILPATRS